MNMKTLFYSLFAFAAISFVACGDDSSSTNSSDPISDDKTPAEIFNPRVPDQKAYACINKEMEINDTLAQHDVICTFKYDGMDGYVYLQAAPTSCTAFMQAIPEFDDVKIQLYVNGSMAKVSKAAYDWGGNHHVDEISFVYDGKEYRYAHSSVGFGWRPCQEMDCMMVYSADGKLVKDGCGEDRSLPIVCNVVDEKGKVGSFEDNFEVCPGDERLQNEEDDPEELDEEDDSEESDEDEFLDDSDEEVIEE